MKVYKEKVNLSCQGMYLKTQRAEPQYKGYKACRLCSCVTAIKVDWPSVHGKSIRLHIRTFNTPFRMAEGTEKDSNMIFTDVNSLKTLEQEWGNERFWKASG